MCKRICKKEEQEERIQYFEECIEDVKNKIEKYNEMFFVNSSVIENLELMLKQYQENLEHWKNNVIIKEAVKNE